MKNVFVHKGGGGMEDLMENSITVNVFFIETLPNDIEMCLVI